MRWTVLRDLAPDEREQVLRACRRRRFQRQEVIFHEGDPGDSLHLIDQGRVAVRVATEMGDTVTLAVLGAGQVFGELALVGSELMRTATVVALEPVETLSLNRSQFDQLRQRYPSVDRFLVEVLAVQVVRLSSHLLEALYVPSERRILRRLGDLAAEYGNGQAGTVIPLTQEDLASMAGTTRPTTNRVLRAAEDAGLVDIGRARITILDPQLLARRAR